MSQLHSLETGARWLAILGSLAGAACSSGSSDGGSVAVGNGGSTTTTTGGAATAGAVATGGGAMSASGDSPSKGGAASDAAGTSGTAIGGSASTGAAGAGGASGVSAAGATCVPNPALPPTTGVCNGTGTRVLSLADAKVEDFEAAVISPGWSSFDQPDNGGAHDVFKMSLVTTDGAATTKHSGEYKGTGILTVKEGGFGAGSVYNVAIDKNLGVFCIDVSAFDGVAFWAKSAVTGKQFSVSFVVPETNPQGAAGGDCTANCYNHPSKVITVTDQWAQYTVKFSEAIAGTAKVNGRVQELLWTTPDKDFDLHLDEIGFYKCTPPVGPVAP
jgi:hypothetical protein